MKKINHPISFGSCEKGLTMIEVLISMAIFAIGFLAIGGLVIGTTKNNTTGNILTEATMLARAKVESLKALSLDQLADACLDENEPEIVNQLYARECDVSALGSSSTIKTIKVIVKWKRSGKLRQVILQTNTRGRGQ
jgi:prepilin-type N-terminal cleavage/methylation domain-containing protein